MKGNAKLPRLTPPELEIMEVVWAIEEVSIPAVVERINAGREKALKRTTVQVQMNRLEEKGWLTHRKEGRTYLYSAVMGRDASLAQIAEDVKNRVFGGSCAAFVRCLFENEGVDKQEIEKLKQLVREAEKEAK